MTAFQIPSLAKGTIPVPEVS